MQYLIACRCGHTVEVHEAAGCAECACEFSNEEALDAAIDRERSRPW
jgi:hypothetical protein